MMTGGTSLGNVGAMLIAIIVCLGMFVGITVAKF